MKKLEPFLFHYKQECTSPTRASIEFNERYEYDNAQAMVLIIEREERIPLIDLPNYAGLLTKKADIEKGDDQKDGRRW